MKNLFCLLKQKEIDSKSGDYIKVEWLLSKTPCLDDFYHFKNKFFTKGETEHHRNCVIQPSK